MWKYQIYCIFCSSEDLHRLLQLLDRGQGGGDADVGILRVAAVGERRARAGHDDARFLAEGQCALGKTRLRVDRDEIAALRPLPGGDAERRDLGIEMAQDALELRVQDGRVLFHELERVGLVLEIAHVAQGIDLVVGDGLDADELLQIHLIGLARGHDGEARAGQRHLRRGGKFVDHIGIARLAAECQDVPEGDEVAVKLVDAVGIVPHEGKIGRGGLQSLSLIHI